jgi:hypothetical protein
VINEAGKRLALIYSPSIFLRDTKSVLTKHQGAMEEEKYFSVQPSKYRKYKNEIHCSQFTDFCHLDEEGDKFLRNVGS